MVRPARPVRLLALLAPAVAIAGCFPASSYECDGDAQCSGGEVCARTHTCELEADVRAARVRWDVEGLPAATECDLRGIGDLTIDFSDRAGAEVAFAPVPCAGGLYTIDKLPRAYDLVELVGYDTTGARYFGTVSLGSELEVMMTLAE